MADLASPAAPSKPADYRDDPALALKKGDSDAKLAKSGAVDYVKQLQRDLITLGYLPAKSDDGGYGGGTERAVRRFQRHARRAFRVAEGTPGRPVPAVPWTGLVTGSCDQATAREIRNWIDRKYRLPLGIYQIEKMDGGKMRADVAKLWALAVADVKAKGGTLLPPGKGASEYYSDTWRNPVNGFKHTGGNSKFSLHYTGRAVDLSMEPAGGKGQRWWIAKEDVGTKVYWRIYCKTEKQDGTQGTKIAAKSKKYYEFWKNTGEKWMPEGYYIDLTEILKNNGFERIPAQAGWETVAKKQEWWHFHYTKDLQETFGDEMELLGYTEEQLNKAGWKDADLEKPPG